jgi:hypothetical protein
MIGWLLLGVNEKSKEGNEIAAEASAAVSEPDFFRQLALVGIAAGAGPEGFATVSARGRPVAPPKRFARHQKVAAAPAAGSPPGWTMRANFTQLYMGEKRQQRGCLNDLSAGNNARRFSGEPNERPVPFSNANGAQRRPTPP